MNASPFSPGCVLLDQGHAGMVGICFKPTPRTALGCLYSTMTYVELRDIGEVVIVFAHHIITIKGKRLETLVENLSKQRVSELRTATRAELGLEGERCGSAVAT